VRPYIKQILESAGRAASLTDGLMAFSRAQQVAKKPVDIVAVVRRTGKLIARTFGAGVRCTTSLPEEEIRVLANADQLQQVLLNLATNARDAIPSGGAFTLAVDRIRLEAVRRRHDGGPPGTCAVISATDTGTGVPDGSAQDLRAVHDEGSRQHGARFDRARHRRQQRVHRSETRPEGHDLPHLPPRTFAEIGVNGARCFRAADRPAPGVHGQVVPLRRARAMKVIFKIEAEDLTGLRVWDQFSERLNRLVDAGFSEIVIDLAAVRNLSSLALGTIVATNQTMASAGRRLVVTNLSEELKRLAVEKTLGVISIE
jgi:hypothetical protein